MRPAGWEARLADWLRETEAAASFSWTRLNCGFLVADAAVAMGLDDPAAQFRDWPVSKLRRLSLKGLLEAVPYTQHESPAFARRGDWTAFDGETGPALALCLGKQSIGFHHQSQRLTRVETLAAHTAFKVE